MSDQGTTGSEFVTVDPREDGPGVTVVDRIQRNRYALRTPGPVSPRPAEPSGFLYPVDTAAVVETEAFELPNVIVVCVRDEDGEMLAQAEQFDHERFPGGAFSIELHAAVKLFLEVEGSVEVHSESEGMTIRFDGERQVRIGARSYHDRPAETVEIPGDPESAMRAVSTFGSALKTLSPERSFPTLRGHPPAVEVGDELDVPEGLEPPESGVRIEVPRDLGAVYAVAPLAYYLGAEVVPGESPRLVTDSGFEYDLGPDVERGAERALKQTFLLDCVVRTEGYFQVDLAERAAVESAVDLDFAALYDAPIAERTERYFGVPFEALADHLPEWKLTGHVRPDPESVESLPYLLVDLPVVRTADREGVDPDPVTTAMEASAIAEFVRGDGANERTLIGPQDADTPEEVWIGEGVPVGAGKATPAAFRNRLDREPTDGSIGVTVVYNDDRMREERSEDGYGATGPLPFEVTVRSDLDREELRTLLGEGTDLLHYVGHVDREGFRCVDGHLDATELDEVGVNAFLLNACHSYDQGMALIDAGAVGGIVTLDAVVNASAVRMGRELARALDAGFSLGAALEVLQDVEPPESEYLVVGDSRHTLAQFPGGTPHACTLERSGGHFELEVFTYPTVGRSLGTVFTPHIPGYDRYHVNSGVVGTFEVSRGELRQFFSDGNVPVFLDGDLHWSEDLDLSAI